MLIATNDVFHSLLLILRIAKDKEYIIELFEKGGYHDVTKSKIKGWQTRSGGYKPGFRAMPEPALRAFINALLDERMISIDGETK